MPLIYDDVLPQIREDCRNPEIFAPSDDLIMQRIGDIAQLLHTESQNTSVNWDLAYHDLKVKANQGEYELPVGDSYGKAVRIHTIDSGDKYHVSRKVEMAERQRIETAYRGPQTAASGAMHSAEVAVLYWKFGVPFLEIIPKPAQAATYRVWFETGEVPEPRLGDRPIPGLPSFHRYVRVYGSALVLPYCEWTDMVEPGWTKDQKEEAFRSRRIELAAAFTPLLDRWTPAWREYIRTERQTGSGRSVGYADYYERECV